MEKSDSNRLPSELREKAVLDATPGPVDAPPPLPHGATADVTAAAKLPAAPSWGAALLASSAPQSASVMPTGAVFSGFGGRALTSTTTYAFSSSSSSSGVPSFGAPRVIDNSSGSSAFSGGSALAAFTSANKPAVSFSALAGAPAAAAATTPAEEAVVAAAPATAPTSDGDADLLNTAAPPAPAHGLGGSIGGSAPIGSTKAVKRRRDDGAPRRRAAGTPLVAGAGTATAASGSSAAAIGLPSSPAPVLGPASLAGGADDDAVSDSLSQQSSTQQARQLQRPAQRVRIAASPSGAVVPAPPGGAAADDDEAALDEVADDDDGDDDDADEDEDDVSDCSISDAAGDVSEAAAPGVEESMPSRAPRPQAATAVSALRASPPSALQLVAAPAIESGAAAAAVSGGDRSADSDEPASLAAGAVDADAFSGADGAGGAVAPCVWPDAVNGEAGTTGEEGESTLLQLRARLFVLNRAPLQQEPHDGAPNALGAGVIADSSSTLAGVSRAESAAAPAAPQVEVDVAPASSRAEAAGPARWRECGIGPLRLNVAEVDAVSGVTVRRIRLIMRHERHPGGHGTRLLLNATLGRDAILVRHPLEERGVTLTVVNAVSQQLSSASALSAAAPQINTYMLKLAKPELAATLVSTAERALAGIP